MKKLLILFLMRAEMVSGSWANKSISFFSVKDLSLKLFRETISLVLPLSMEVKKSSLVRLMVINLDADSKQQKEMLSGSCPGPRSPQLKKLMVSSGLVQQVALLSLTTMANSFTMRQNVGCLPTRSGY